MVAHPPWLPLEELSLGLALAALVVALAVVLGAADRRPAADALRSRFLLGVPWGTLTVVALLVASYELLQGGLSHPQPLVLPFRTWSYQAPLGMLTGAFTHGGDGHLTGNALATLALAPVVEYVWGHYPTRRGVQTFTSLRTNPFARILGFVAGVIAVGLVSDLFLIGPVVGFSGVVFAFAGAGLVSRPLTTLLALLGQQVLSMLWRTVRSPVLPAEAKTRFISPSWAGVAVQGHLLGLLLGVAVGLYLVGRRRRIPSVGRVWFAVLVFGAARGLWALYWQSSGTEFLLLRGLGVALVLGLGALVALAVVREGPAVPGVDVSFRQFAVVLLVAITVGAAAPAVPYNVADFEGPPADADTLSVRGYDVAYAEGVTNGYTAAVPLPGLNESAVTASGIIVVNERRNVWQLVVSKQRLAFQGRSTIPVGGVGWRAPIRANRTGWRLTGGPPVYSVALRAGLGAWQQVYRSPDGTAGPVVAGAETSLQPTRTGFDIVANRTGAEPLRAPVPANNASVSLGNLTYRRNDSRLVLTHERTQVTIAQRETGNRERSD